MFFSIIFKNRRKKKVAKTVGKTIETNKGKVSTNYCDNYEIYYSFLNVKLVFTYIYKLTFSGIHTYLNNYLKLSMYVIVFNVKVFDVKK